jgi:succinate dehydrogenase hydrophobic anchor subunit
MKNRVETNKTKQKDLITVIITGIILVGLTCVLLTIMKNSYPFNTNQNNVFAENLNSTFSNIKTTDLDWSIIITVLSLMALITIKLKKALNRV